MFSLNMTDTCKAVLGSSSSLFVFLSPCSIFIHGSLSYRAFAGCVTRPTLATHTMEQPLLHGAQARVERLHCVCVHCCVCFHGVCVCVHCVFSNMKPYNVHYFCIGLLPECLKHHAKVNWTVHTVNRCFIIYLSIYIYEFLFVCLFHF